MIKTFFGWQRTPFIKEIPTSELYQSAAFKECVARLNYMAGEKNTIRIGECNEDVIIKIGRQSKKVIGKIHGLVAMLDRNDNIQINSYKMAKSS